MTATTSGLPQPATGALIPPPTVNARPAVVTTMALAQLGLFFAVLTPVFSSLAIKVQALVGEERAVGALATVSGIGAVAAFLANPIFGRISDRTTGRFGRRRPWLVVGALGLTASLLVIALTQSLVVVVIAWFAAQTFTNAALAAFTATLADQVPVRQRGTVSGLIGVMMNAGILGAAYVAQFFGTDMLLLFMIPGLVGLALVVLYAIVLPDKPLPRRPPSEGFRTVLKTFWVSPRRYPDFALAWTSRFMVILATFMFTTYRLLFLQDRLELSTEDATAVMATGVLIYTIVLVVGAQIAGWASDRLRRRKVFVFIATLVFAAGTLLMIPAETAGGFYLAEAVLGLGYGVYIGVDLALVTDVLPNPDDSAKDLGVFNIANAGPQAIAPVFGAVLVTAGGGGNYNLMIIVAGVIAVLGALVVLPIKSVR